MDEKLGLLTKVDIRSQWTDEAIKFPPWLASKENVSRLSDAIGIELELESTEVAEGPHPGDILGRDLSTGDYVLIENQLGKTSDDRLGKSLTYAAGLNASSVVWLASDFTEDHKKALDWLNDISSEHISFFGVLIELWRIDDSKPAVKFTVVSRPAKFPHKSTITKELISSSEAHSTPSILDARVKSVNDQWTKGSSADAHSTSPDTSQSEIDKTNYDLQVRPYVEAIQRVGHLETEPDHLASVHGDSSDNVTDDEPAIVQRSGESSDLQNGSVASSSVDSSDVEQPLDDVRTDQTDAEPAPTSEQPKAPLNASENEGVQPDVKTVKGMQYIPEVGIFVPSDSTPRWKFWDR